jgi:hypothetical protein
MPKYYRGQVLRATYVQFNGDVNDGHFSAEFLPAWGVVEHVPPQNGGTGGMVYQLSDWPEANRHYSPPRMKWDESCDQFEVMPPEQWPDEVCAAMAVWTLLEESN